MNEERVLYLECKSGISGDMTVAALLDLGVDESAFAATIESLGLEGVSYAISKVDKNGITARDFDVRIEGENPAHEHHHHEHEHGHHHGHGHHEHEHRHEPHEHSHVHEHAAHEHRNFGAVRDIIEKSALSERAKGIAVRTFEIVAEAEAKVHGKAIDEVHFHEVGALDSIMDIAAAAFCIDFLNVERIAVSVLSEGNGYVNCQHGRLPVPVPATSEIAARYGIPLSITECPYELITPTGIALVAALKNTDSLPASFTIKKIGYGAGKRNLEHPNILRALLVEETGRTNSGPETDKQEP